MRLTPDACNEHRLHIFFDELQRRAPKQLDLLMKYLEQSGHLGGNERPVAKRDLLQRTGATAGVFNGLVERGIFQVYQAEVGRLDRHLPTGGLELPHTLSTPQQQAYEAIRTSFSSKKVCLLYGVTSSGKTEIYIHLIKDALERGEQVLYLLPEIALTTQITERLKRVFGERLGIYHSKFPDAERVEIWQRQLSDNPYGVILGVRSSVFLPFQKPALPCAQCCHRSGFPLRSQDSVGDGYAQPGELAQCADR